ncbi:MAG: glycosyltransferase [Paludibacter sp.]|nr:glycosyltransferase [Paludibacter sp.]
MKICFYFPGLGNDQNNAIFGSMYFSFFQQLELKGLCVKFTTKIEEIEGDILVVSIGNSGEISASKAMHNFKGPIILSIYNSYICFYKSFLKRWKSRFLFAYNPDFATLNFNKYNSVGIPYYHFPFGSDNNIFHPVEMEKKYDITFLGNASSGSGRDKYIKKLLEYAKTNKLNVFLAGSGWDNFGFPYQIVKHGVDTNNIYNASKVCINIHNDRQYAGIDKEMDANNRLFDLAMAECCQVSNGEQTIIKYFKKDEIATADDPDEWIQKIDYYLNHEAERKVIAQNARKRALKEHTWDKRADDFIRFINETYPNYTERNQKTSLFISILRYLDQYIIPPYQWKEIKIIRFFLKKLGLYT